MSSSNIPQQQADQKRGEAEARDTLSHATAKAGPYTLTSSGVSKDSEDRTQGNWNQTIGSGKEALGNLTGITGLKNEGIKQNQEGKEQEAQGQLSDLSGGVGNRVGGAVQGAVAGLTGDRELQQRAQDQHDEGKAKQRSVEADLQKQVDAEQKQ